jgi:hypothetical protein
MKIARIAAATLVAAGLLAGTAGVASAAPTGPLKKSVQPAEWLR